jgi:hypothetical protein
MFGFLDEIVGSKYLLRDKISTSIIDAQIGTSQKSSQPHSE